jgi:hypothetical protein
MKKHIGTTEDTEGAKNRLFSDSHCDQSSGFFGVFGGSEVLVPSDGRAQIGKAAPTSGQHCQNNISPLWPSADSPRPLRNKIQSSAGTEPSVNEHSIKKPRPGKPTGAFLCGLQFPP